MDRIACRGLIIHENKLLTVRLKDYKHFCLPGGTLEKDEEITQCIQREIQEELWITPILWNIAFIHELIIPETHLIEFFYVIKNPQDFLSIDLAKASHWFEIKEMHWLDIENPDVEFLAKELLVLLKDSKPEDLEKTRIITRR